MHLLSCPKCAEELEIYYIIVNCIRGLDDEIDFSDDYHREYINFLKSTEREIKLFKKKNMRHRTAFSAAIAISVILTGVSFKTESDETTEKQLKSRDIIKSDLDMRFRFRDNHVYFNDVLDMERLRTLIQKRGR